MARRAVEQPGGAVAVHHDRWRVAGAGVTSSPVSGVSTAQNAVVHRAPGSRAANRSSADSASLGLGPLEKQCATSTSQLAHHRRGREAVADAVADDQRDAPVVEVDDVIPVAADLKRPRRGLVAHRESTWQLSRTEYRFLQRQRRLALLIELVDSLQPLAEPTGQHRQQHLVLGGEAALFGKLDLQRREHPAGAAARCPPRQAVPCQESAGRLHPAT